MEIGWIEVLKKVYGETIYTDMVQSILSKHYHLEMINVGLDRFKKYLYPKLLYRLCRVRGEKDLWIRNFDSVLTMPYDGTRGKNVALIFHIDYSFQPAYLKPSWMILEKIFYNHLKKADAIITISRYWQSHLWERGYPNVYLIYNGFDLDQFQFEEEEVFEFRRKFQLRDKPIIYVGNCQRIKGVVETCEHLKELDVYLVTSGRKEVDIPASNLNLDYRDYLLLLRSSSVVITMSKFMEGWNRTAHEAMLCKTPVIGSGLGGMKELLEGGNQIICEDFDALKDRVLYALKHPELGEPGYAFAKQFTLKKFTEEWLGVIEQVNEKE
jgi:glycosyltransferase involved in cell wall biosynthesis